MGVASVASIKWNALQEEVQKRDFEREEPNELMEKMTRGIREATFRKTIKMKERKIGWKKW